MATHDPEVPDLRATPVTPYAPPTEEQAPALDEESFESVSARVGISAAAAAPLPAPINIGTAAAALRPAPIDTGASAAVPGNKTEERVRPPSSVGFAGAEEREIDYDSTGLGPPSPVALKDDRGHPILDPPAAAKPLPPERRSGRAASAKASSKIKADAAGVEGSGVDESLEERSPGDDPDQALVYESTMSAKAPRGRPPSSTSTRGRPRRKPGAPFVSRQPFGRGLQAGRRGMKQPSDDVDAAMRELGIKLDPASDLCLENGGRDVSSLPNIHFPLDEYGEPYPFKRAVTVKMPDQSGPILMEGPKGRAKMLEVRESGDGYVYTHLRAEIHQRTERAMAKGDEVWCKEQRTAAPSYCVASIIEPFNDEGVCVLEEETAGKCNGVKWVGGEMVEKRQRIMRMKLAITVEMQDYYPKHGHERERKQYFTRYVPMINGVAYEEKAICSPPIYANR